MCRCTPSIRTPYCGKPNCHPPTSRPGISITVSTTLTREQVDRLDELCVQHGVERDQILRWALATVLAR